ncbi:MAG: NUDIX domain-containing protein, partial [Eubacterium sp.]|nr:NUDIX domain-containing protein [Eubacterium sp.]
IEIGLQEKNISVKKIQSLGAAKHIFSHIEWHMKGYLVEVESGALEQWEDMKKIQFVTSRALQENYSLPTAFRTYREKIEAIEKILEEKSSPEPL